MVYSLTYRRPDYVPQSRGSISGSIDSEKSEKADSVERSGSLTLAKIPINLRGIPEALSFDRIIVGGCCPPCGLREFMNYLKYIEHSAENLQFFLWFKDYEKRFSMAPESAKALAPEWTAEMAEAERLEYLNQIRNVKVGHVEDELFKGTDFDNKRKYTETEKLAPLSDATSSDFGGDEAQKARSITSSHMDKSVNGVDSIMTGSTKTADNAFEEAGLKKPFTVQPYREEMSQILSIYFLQGGARELNLSARERHAVLKALQYTTHPSAFRGVVSTVEYSLRRQAHPNFIRWAICNGNRPRVVFARGLGVFLISAAIVTDILLTLSKVGRAWRVLPIILFILGISTLIAAWKGMCVVLHGLHHRHVRPWELFSDAESPSKLSSDSQRTSISNESLQSMGSNSFEDEPWVKKYERRNIIRKVLDREMWIEEPALRQIQDTIFLQAILSAALISAVIIAIFVAVPGGKMY